jgi:hypothetical protein
LGIEKWGKINASNSGSDNCTGIGVVTDCGAVVLIRHGLMGSREMRAGESNWLRFYKSLGEITKLATTYFLSAPIFVVAVPRTVLCGPAILPSHSEL